MVNGTCVLDRKYKEDQLLEVFGEAATHSNWILGEPREVNIKIYEPSGIDHEVYDHTEIEVKGIYIGLTKGTLIYDKNDPRWVDLKQTRTQHILTLTPKFQTCYSFMRGNLAKLDRQEQPGDVPEIPIPTTAPGS